MQSAGCFAVKFGTLIRQRRLEVGITQEALADTVGITQPSVSAQERGEAVPTAFAFVGLLRALEIDIADVFALMDDGCGDGAAA
jgi:transcriptional regulator with XRE-family HTH domain